MEMEISLPGEQVMPIPKLGNKNKRSNKSKANGFFCFAQAQKQKLSATHDIKGNSQLVALCDPLWRSMSAEEKKLWTQRAKEEQARTQARAKTVTVGGVGELRMDCNRQMISQRQATERAEQDRRESERLYCRTIIKRCEEILSLEFCIVDCLTTIDYNDGVFVPCEVGIVRCSLTDGVIGEYHFFPDPGTLRHGHFHEAMSKADLEHEISPIGFKYASRDYEKDVAKLIDLMCLSNPMVRPLIFSRSVEAKRSEGCFHWLDSRVENNMKVVVMDLEMWIMELASAASQATHSLAQVRRYLYETKFDFAPGIRCDFHRTTDKTACAIGHAKKWFYFLIEIIFDCYDINVVGGKHYPKGAQFGVQALQPSNTTSDSNIVLTNTGSLSAYPSSNTPYTSFDMTQAYSTLLSEETSLRSNDDSKSHSSRGRGRSPSNLLQNKMFSQDSISLPTVNSFMNLKQTNTMEPLPYSRGRGRARGLTSSSEETPRRPHSYGQKS